MAGAQVLGAFPTVLMGDLLELMRVLADLLHVTYMYNMYMYMLHVTCYMLLL